MSWKESTKHSGYIDTGWKDMFHSQTWTGIEIHIQYNEVNEPAEKSKHISSD